MKPLPVHRRVKLRKGGAITVPLGVVLLFPAIVIVLIIVLFARHPGLVTARDVRSTSYTSTRRISERHDKVFVSGCLDPRPQIKNPRANAAIVVLARNQEREGVVYSIRSIERHFNRWFHYPYVFLNDGEFDDAFKEKVQRYASGSVEFGRVGSELWDFPEWADPAEYKEAIAKQGDAAIMYGELESYHHMCRFYSGKFYKHELLQKYDWYWRLEPWVKFYCDITYDPFVHMERANKTYGFTIAIKELKATVPNIFRHASAYKRHQNLTSTSLWDMFIETPDEEADEEELDRRQREFKERGEKWPPKSKGPLEQDIFHVDPSRGRLEEIDEDAMEGEKYNMCHFWSNFEIARLDWFRSAAYNDFFEAMDRSGGFWTERWGDAPIHSLAAGILLGVDDIHYFRDFGYRHTTIGHCPANAPDKQLPHMPYSDKDGDLSESELAKENEYWANFDPEEENGIGCRCRCDTDIKEVELKEGSCIIDWVRVAGGWSSP